MKVKKLPKGTEYRNWVFRNDPELATGMAYTVKLLKSKIKSFEKRRARAEERLRWVVGPEADLDKIDRTFEPASQTSAFKNYLIRERDKLTQDLVELKKALAMLENHVLQTCETPKPKRRKPTKL